MEPPKLVKQFDPYQHYQEQLAAGESPLCALPTDLIKYMISFLGVQDPAHYLLKFVCKKFCHITLPMNEKKAVENAVARGYLTFLKTYFSEEYRIPDNFMRIAARAGQLEVIQWLISRGERITAEVVMDATQEAQLPMMEWLHTHTQYHVPKIWPLPSNAISWAARKGNVEALNWTLQMGCVLSPDVASGAARGGHLELLQDLRGRGCKWNQYSCAEAAAGGHFRVLEWLRENGCPWNEKTCYKAAGGGHLGLLQWAWAKGCDWNSKTYTRAARSGHLAILVWASANGCPLQRDRVIETDDPEVRKWALENGCEVDKVERKRLFRHKMNRYPAV